MDDLMLRHSTRALSIPANLKIVEKFVKKNYGFDYEWNFRQTLMKLIGIVTCEQIEAAMDIQIHTKFTAELNSLKQVRDSLAHTYTKAVTQTIDAPSRTKARFHDLHAGLKAYEQALATLRGE